MFVKTVSFVVGSIGAAFWIFLIFVVSSAIVEWPILLVPFLAASAVLVAKYRQQPRWTPHRPAKTYRDDGTVVYHYYDESGEKIGEIDTRGTSMDPSYYRRMTLEEGWKN